MRRKIIPYKPHLREIASKLRNNPTDCEKKLWQHLKGKQMLGYDFDRQKPLDNYIVDFFCHDLMLAIEVDGETHFDNEGRTNQDKQRQQCLEDLGINFLRFTNEDVKQNINGILETVQNWIMGQR
jgi:very-short-patch-repair endonuclease